MTAIYCHVGSRLKLRRLVQKMSGQELAERCGITYILLLDLEAGRRPMSIKHMFNLTRALDVDANFFFEGFEPTEVANPDESSAELPSE